MDVKSANPFLFAEDDYTSPSAASSNPFLMAEDDFADSTGNDNPFQSQAAISVAPAGGTNPFAFDAMDMGPAEAAPAFDVVTTFQNTFMTNTYIDNLAMVQQPQINFFAEPANTQSFYSQPNSNHPFFIDTESSTSIPQKPTELDLRYTNTVATDERIFIEKNDGPAKLPQPPRPPPSKETQDLLMTVMGAMDATSSHLLDRIPPTRTPSPVSMRDLHSPSPTPEPQFVNLLDVSDTKTPLVDTSQSVNLLVDDLMGQTACDINKNLQEQTIGVMTPVMAPVMAPINVAVPNEAPVPVQSTLSSMVNVQTLPSAAFEPAPVTNICNMPSTMNVSTTSANVPQDVLTYTVAPTSAPESTPLRNIPPMRPGPPIRPPRPTPPMKPPPPVITHAPPKPPPPVFQPVQEAPAPSPMLVSCIAAEPVDEMIEIFGSQQQAAKSKADILNLYKKTETPLDLLCDGMDAAPSSIEAIDGSASGTNSRKSSVPSRKSSIPSRKSSIPSIENTNTTTAPSVDVHIIEPTDTCESPSPAPENYLSPEPSQADLQMDTSDSQSKGSVSSVSMNPFAINDEMTSPAVSDIQPTSDTTPKVDNNGFHDEEIIESDNVAPFTQIFGTTQLIQNDEDAFNVSPPERINELPEKAVRSTTNQRFGFSGNKTDSFDAFAAKFELVKDENKNGAFGPSNDDTWGNSAFGTNDFKAFNDDGNGFGADDSFDAFLALQEPPSVPQSTPSKLNRTGSIDSDEDRDFSVVIKPKMNDEGFGDNALPILAPPPISTHTAFPDISTRSNPFDNSGFAESAVQYQEPVIPESFPGGEAKRSDGEESPGTPLFDEDVSQPLEPFPRLDFIGEGFELQLRQPNKKKITGQRFWKKIFIRLNFQSDCILLQLFNQQTDKDPFQELPLQPCYSVSDISAQQYDNYGKIFTVKLQYIFYKERPGVRPGQVKKAERLTNKLSQFAAYAIQGDYQGVKEFGSDLKKLGLPVEHAPQISQLMKIGSLNYEDLKQFSVSVEEALFKLQAHRDRALHYKMEEVQITCVDELYVHQSSEGHIEKQVARVRLFFLGFLTGMPDIELGVNDMRRQGKEVVGRHDIIPVVTEEWIRLEAVEFHNCIQQDEYNDTHIIKFKPPDACYIELMRFRVRPPKNRELPLQLKATICVNGTKVEIRADILVPGFASRKLGQVPCEDVMVRFPIPECWIYLFRVEKHFRYGSVKSAHRRTGKIKGIERILGTVDTLQESLIEVTSGQAKYEHQHRAIVWRCPRLPKEGQGAYTTHNLVCRMALTSFDQVPDQLAEYCYVEFTMPATQASHTTVRSVSIQNSDSDEPPEKFVRHLARHEYRVGIEHVEAEGPNAYLSAAMTKPKPKPPPPEEKPKPIPEAVSSSDSD